MDYTWHQLLALTTKETSIMERLIPISMSDLQMSYVGTIHGSARHLPGPWMV